MHHPQNDIRRGDNCCVSKAYWKASPYFVTRLIVLITAARDRVSLLLDHGSPFLELGSFAGFRNKDSTPNANIIAGIGNVA